MTSQLDIINRALQKLGKSRIASLTDQSGNAAETVFAWTSLLRAELRRNVWRFSIRTVALRALASTMKQITFGTYSATAAYAQNDVVTASDGQVYVALVANTGSDPTTTVGKWTTYFGPVVASAFVAADKISYYAGEIVAESGTTYVSLVSNNLTDPATDLTGSWLTFTTQPALSKMNFIYPIGSGPSGDNTTRNVFMLPYGFMREASQSPKAQRNAFLGGPAGLRPNDWLYENQCFTSADPGPILYRFAAMVSDTTQFDPLFVEGFACRLGMEACEILTEETTKVALLLTEYKKFMSEARTVNGIEKGPEDPDIDDYISVRL